MEDAAIGETPFPFEGNGDSVVGKPCYEGGKVWINATRKTALAEVPGLTMTEIYNLVAWLKSSPTGGGGARAARVGGGDTQDTPRPDAPPPPPFGRSPSPKGEDLGDRATQKRANAARAGIVGRLHQQIDAAVAAAYGWPADLPPAEIVARLVALNAERAAEEAAGTVRWLRPDYQIPRFGAAKG